ncbi:polysaccharide pyruvyl transferase family protein [Noviherbaspirillum pedocola]|uniref:Polysaccharide pyruvyl transferase family protein n=1 Tax=Noviherbaspirillum pedocola TaxID=2801341 RepID=A0A934SYH8_9BURK|nr:polysaccharide pyruvyl transferase family protein [Noviherbaspirillum pedocola]MBK4738885.1 polysaccharide pyruvyl transferase family protein [Noviherbaspirillum pedocola]
MSASPRPTIIFGAFDRHNLGDMLFAHVLQALLAPRPLAFAGLIDADLRGCGGHRVHALRRLALRLPGANLVHAGGEILSCDAPLAAAMLLPPRQAQDLLPQDDAPYADRLAWARQRLGMPDLAPYVAGRDAIPQGAALLHNAVGGADLDSAEPALREEVRRKLAQADVVTVRDARSAAALAGLGIASRLLPDPVCLLRELFGAPIAQRARQGEVAAARAGFADGYLAVQCSADFGDDATLSAMAAGLEALARARGLGIVFFRAGAALWHDELETLQRLKARMRMPAMLMTSLDIVDICALIAASRGYLGSSLHGRIVAMAYALPRANLLFPGTHNANNSAKHDAYAAIWEAPGLPTALAVSDIPEAMRAALDAAPRTLEDLARAHAAIYRSGFAQLRAMLQ